jgi:DNA-binding phage protein
MAEMHRNSSHDIDIERAAQELEITEEDLRDWMDTADDEERMRRAADLAVRGRGAEKVARVLGISEETLRQRLRRDAEWYAKTRPRLEAPKNQRPHYLEYPPS